MNKNINHELTNLDILEKLQHKDEKNTEKKAAPKKR